jgi:hypothetical protein
MIPCLFSIISCSNGNIWRQGTKFRPLDIGCGLMGVPPNLSLSNLGILLSISRFDKWVYDELELFWIWTWQGWTWHNRGCSCERTHKNNWMLMAYNYNVQIMFVTIWHMFCQIGLLPHMLKRKHLWNGFSSTLVFLLLIDTYLGNVKLWRVVGKSTKSKLMGILWNFRDLAWF